MGVFLLFFFFLFGLQLVGCQRVDLPAMLALRKELAVPEWLSGDPNYCLWRGVTCGPPSSSVEELRLSRRNLRGNVSVVSQLKSLKVLDLSSNSFTGSVPDSFGDLLVLEFLDMSMNRFEGSIPSSLGGVWSLRALNLSNNLLTGGIPDELKGLEKLEELQVSGNRLSGVIPAWVGKLRNLRVLSAYENQLVGEIPRRLGSVSPLEVLNLHSNRLEGPVLDSIFLSGKLQVLILTMNRLNGSLPNLIGNCPDLSNFRVGNNAFVGRIPDTIGTVGSLTYFEANNNDLSGEIVPDFAKCSNLTLLNLSYNQLSGAVPSELGVLNNLQEFITSGNKLSGEIPTPLLRCKNLSKLDLSYNRIGGSLPDNLCNNTSRLQFLILDHNMVRGEIPPGIGKCARLLELQLSNNHLTGEIPQEIGNIRSLQIALNLSSNFLHGMLPRELGRLDKLVTLDVSNNQLSGNIPVDLKGMLSLIDVNFSNNKLTDQIPIFSPFQKSPSSSFLGNKGLCGNPLSISPGDSCGGDQNSNHHMASYKIILTVVGSGLAVFLMVTVVVVLFVLRERQEMAQNGTASKGDVVVSVPAIVAANVFVENMRQAVDFDSVVKATMKESNMLSSGTFSTAYKAVMPSGLVLSVRRLKSVDRTVTHYQSKMIRELERLGNLCHKNVMKPIGFVIYEDVALLLHPFMPNGTLAKLIHEVSEAEFRPNWPTRLSIATEVAEGLAFLHKMAIIHLDISSGNVNLDADFNPVIGEIEISKLLDPSKGTASISAVAGSLGYISPEYAYTMQVTTPGNVYSYGVVLLEILTSRWPIDEAFGEGMDLVKWIRGAPDRGETPEQIMDARLSTVSFSWRKQMLEVLKIALLCTDVLPARRPKMKKVVEMLLEVNKR